MAHKSQKQKPARTLKHQPTCQPHAKSQWGLFNACLTSMCFVLAEGSTISYSRFEFGVFPFLYLPLEQKDYEPHEQTQTLSHIPWQIPH